MNKKYLILSVFLFFFSVLPSVHAAEIHSFSINNEGKYFIYYSGDVDSSIVERFRNKAVEILPIIEQWGGVNPGKVRMAIVPNTFEEYQALYEGTDLWNSFGLKMKGNYISGIARPQKDAFILAEFSIKNSIWNTAEHELCHLVAYPFTFDHYFGEGEATSCQVFVAKKLGEPLYSQNEYRKTYSQFSSEQKKIYGISSLKLDNSLVYPVGTIFIEKLLDAAGTQDLSAFHTTLLNDFSDVVAKYQEHNLALIAVDSSGREVIDLDLIYVNFDGMNGQEVMQCELIKTYGDKVAPVFPEFGFPDAVNCDAKISAFKEKKLKELNDWLRLIKTGDARDTHEDIEATEQDQWVGKDVVFSQAERTADRTFRPIFENIPNKIPGAEVSSHGYPMLSFLANDPNIVIYQTRDVVYITKLDTGTEAFIEGVGVHQGEKITFPQVFAKSFTADKENGKGFTGKIEGLDDILVSSSMDVIIPNKDTGDEWLLPKMEVKKDASIGLKEATLIIEQNGKVIGTIPFVVDVEPFSEDVANNLLAKSADENTSSGATTSSKDMALIIIVSIGIFILTVIAVYLIKKNQNKTIRNPK